MYMCSGSQKLGACADQGLVEERGQRDKDTSLLEPALSRVVEQRRSPAGPAAVPPRSCLTLSFWPWPGGRFDHGWPEVLYLVN